jgi:hypothetical protein
MTLFFVVDDSISNFKNSEIENYLDNFLFPINEIDASNNEYITKLISMGKTLLIDSGIFSLCSEYASKNSIPLEQAFTVNPEKFDGFDKLYEKYIRVIGELKDNVWGYIELDIGGQENKKRIRAELEKKGLNPIPVYHPIGDDYDYFDYLCRRYNKICVGNLVNAATPVKNKIIWGIDKRRRKYPDLWIHYLGISLSECCFNFQIDSCDSSGITSIFRWRKIHSKALLRNCDCIQKKIFNYNGRIQREKAYKISAINVHSNIKTCQNYLEELNVYQR